MCVGTETALAVAAIASSTMSAAQGVMAYGEGQQKKKSYRAAARQELINTAVEETEYRREARKFSARQRVNALATGGDVSSGSLDAALSEDAQTLELNALMRRYAGETEADGLKFQGTQAMRSGQAALGMGFMQAGVEAIGANSRGDFDVFKKAKDK